VKTNIPRQLMIFCLIEAEVIKLRGLCSGEMVTFRLILQHKAIKLVRVACGL
jgi:hypothetical protein